MNLYYMDISAIDENESEKWRTEASEERRIYADRMKRSSGKKRSLASDHLSRLALSEYAGCRREDIIFGKDEYGKPHAVNIRAGFNISHSGDYVVCAVSDCELGVDIEFLRPVNLKIARRFCTAEELEYLFGHEPQPWEFDIKAEDQTAELRDRFFALWTAKEAFCKYTGRGISEIMSSYCVVQNKVLAEKLKIKEYPEVCLLSLCMPANYCTSLIWPAADRNKEIKIYMVEDNKCCLREYDRTER